MLRRREFWLLEEFSVLEIWIWGASVDKEEKRVTDQGLSFSNTKRREWRREEAGETRDRTVWWDRRKIKGPVSWKGNQKVCQGGSLKHTELCWLGLTLSSAMVASSSTYWCLTSCGEQEKGKRDLEPCFWVVVVVQMVVKKWSNSCKIKIYNLLSCILHSVIDSIVSAILP
jgi:hypothetical protein